MANFIEYNANYQGKRVGDCTVRAISKALNQSWQETYSGIAIQGMLMANMPSGNAVWGAYLRHKGFERYIIPDTCPDCYTVRDFCDEHPNGSYILALGSHAVAVENGNYYDTWDSGDEIPLYYFKKKEE
jgi:hypothetical protein